MEPEIEPSSRTRNSLWPLVLLGILVSALSLLTSKRNQPSEALHPEDSTHPKGNRAPQKSPVLSEVVPAPPDSSNAKGSKHDTPLWEKFTVVIAFALLAVNICQMRSTEKAAKAAQTASETGRKQLESSERPWLKVSFVVQQPGITFKDGGMQLSITPRIENIGHSVAIGVVSPMQMFLADDADTMFKEPLKRQKEFCDKLANQPVVNNRGTGVVIFPNDSDSSWGYGLGLSKAEVNAAKDGRVGVMGANLAGPKLLVPIVYGCVDYVYDTSERHHQTQFILELQQTNRTSTIPNRIPMIAIRANQPVDASNVVISKYPFGGFYAY